MSAVARAPAQPAVVALLLRREAGAAVRSPWPWALASLACLLAWLHGGAFARGFATESVLVAVDPLGPLTLGVVAVLALLHGLRLAGGLAWEREHRTLELLLLGPASMTSVILGKLLAEVLLFAAVLAVYAAYLLLAQPLGAGVIEAADVARAALLPVHALPLIALGLLAGARAGTVRGAVAAYLGIVLALGLVAGAAAWLAAQPPQTMGLAALRLRALLEIAAAALDPVSPVARLADAARALSAEAPRPALGTVLALVQTVALPAVADLLARRRGAF